VPESRPSICWEAYWVRRDRSSHVPDLGLASSSDQNYDAQGGDVFGTDLKLGVVVPPVVEVPVGVSDTWSQTAGSPLPRCSNDAEFQRWAGKA
jgi:hypothetical protein